MPGRLVNILQNILICLLAVSGLFLTVLTQLDPQTIDDFFHLLPTGQAITGTVSRDPESPTAPETMVRVAVSGKYGRYGEIHLTSTGSRFVPIRSLLQEALDSAGAPTPCTEQELRTALSLSSIYCDWPEPMPMPVIAQILEAASPDADLPVSRIAAAVEGNAVSLFFTDDVSFFRCTTDLSPQTLLDTIDSLQMESAVFAYELNTTNIAPYTLLPTGELFVYPVLDSVSGMPQSDFLLSALGFNPNTNSRYTESNGTEVIRDGERVLRLEADSSLVYDNGGISKSELAISFAGESPTAWEAALGCFGMFSNLTEDSSARLYLRSIVPAGTGWRVTFDYQVNSIPVRLSSGEPAVQAEVDSTGITKFTMHLRRYTLEGSGSSLLPLRQALAIAANSAGEELTICYVDNGSTASTTWLKD